MVLWSGFLLLCSCAIAVLIGIHPGTLGKIIIPLIIDSSAWYFTFEQAPQNSKVHLGCDLKDGSYIGGYLDWYNTNVDDDSDRDLVLIAPIILKVNGKEFSSEFQRTILSAREILKINVTFVGPEFENDTVITSQD